MTVRRKDWRWFGCAGHFIGWHSCYFRLHTRIGDYRISSVGDYHPHEGIPAKEIGVDRLYETFVFRVSGEDEDGEGVPDLDEIDSLPANTESEARANHMTMCEKYARLA